MDINTNKIIYEQLNKKLNQDEILDLLDIESTISTTSEKSLQNDDINDLNNTNDLNNIKDLKNTIPLENVSSKLNDDNNEWFKTFYSIYNDKAEEYINNLKECGCFNEKDWKTNAKHVWQKVNSRDSIGYEWLWNKIKHEYEINSKCLCLSELDIETIPMNISGLKHLTKLCLRYCGIYYLPEEIGQINNLDFIQIQNCPIFELPKSIGNLSNLSYLEITNTYIKSIPNTIINLEKLKSVSLINNEIESFSFYYLKGSKDSLEFLSLAGNPVYFHFSQNDPDIENVISSTSNINVNKEIIIFSKLKKIDLNETFINEFNFEPFPLLEYLSITNGFGYLKFNYPSNELASKQPILLKLIFIDLSNNSILKLDFENLINNSPNLRKIILRKTIIVYDKSKEKDFTNKDLINDLNILNKNQWNLDHEIFEKIIINHLLYSRKLVNHLENKD